MLIHFRKINITPYPNTERVTLLSHTKNIDFRHHGASINPALLTSMLPCPAQCHATCHQPPLVHYQNKAIILAPRDSKEPTAHIIK